MGVGVGVLASLDSLFGVPRLTLPPPFLGGDFFEYEDKGLAKVHTKVRNLNVFLKQQYCKHTFCQEDVD